MSTAAQPVTGDGDDDPTWARRMVGHTGPLLRFARAFTSDGTEAEDLVQETLLRAYRSRASFRGDSSELTWLRSILRNLAIDRARRPVREISVEQVEEDWRDDRYTVDAETVVELADTRDDLLDALSRLSHAYRTMVVLHDVEGWTVAEAAEVLGIELPAAKQRLRRGRMALVSALAAGGEHRPEVGKVPLRCWDARRHVSDYLDDALDPGVRRAVEAHVEGCPTCPALVAAVVGTTQALGRMRDPDHVVDPVVAERIRGHVAATDTPHTA
ncbi:MAG: sigma-70 family RNA polymerase sigma factor [Acidimicrobiales bacterium]|nr:sigma-70 family RNA polymerase sigma factor [Acidimicrobiales bacterium]